MISPREPRQFCARCRLQIGDRRDSEEFGRRKIRRSSGACAVVQDAKRVGVTRLGAQLIAAGDRDEFIGPCAQIVANVGEKIVEIAGAADEFGQRLTRHGRRRGEDRRFDASHPVCAENLIRVDVATELAKLVE